MLKCVGPKAFLLRDNGALHAQDSIVIEWNVKVPTKLITVIERTGNTQDLQFTVRNRREIWLRTRWYL